MSSIVNFVNSLSNTRQILPSIPGDVFERAGPGYYDKSYPDEIEHNGYVDSDEDENVPMTILPPKLHLKIELDVNPEP